MQVIFTPLAVRQIDKLHQYITEHASEERADGYVIRIIDYCNGFVPFPERGTKRDDILPGLRVTGFERRVTIAFVITADAVLIEGIFYGGQDLRLRFVAGFEAGQGIQINARPAMQFIQGKPRRRFDWMACDDVTGWSSMRGP